MTDLGADRGERVFPALLKYWRGHRGMSQLDLALAAEVSARHISFLETARSRPSVEMVLTLAETLDVPLRNRNELLRAAGFGARYPEPGIDALLDGPLGATIDTMAAHHEPFPLIVVDRTYRVMRMNRAGRTLVSLTGADPDAADLNLVRLVIAPSVSAMVTNAGQLAGDVARRLQREVLHNPLDEELAELLADVIASGLLDQDWRSAAVSASDEPMITIDLAMGEVAMSFLTTITVFNAASNVTLDELRIESWYPRDEVTAQWCHELLAGHG
jgi:transcriptional regulator with XRE-family HTH domain